MYFLKGEKHLPAINSNLKHNFEKKRQASSIHPITILFCIQWQFFLCEHNLIKGSRKDSNKMNPKNWKNNEKISLFQGLYQYICTKQVTTS